MTFGHQQTWESGFNSVFRKMKSLLGLGDYLKQEFVSVCIRVLCTTMCWDFLVVRSYSVFLKVVGHLQSITGITSESIAEFSYAILTHSVGTHTPGQQQPVPHKAARALRTAASSNTWGWLNPRHSLLSLYSSLCLLSFSGYKSSKFPLDSILYSNFRHFFPTSETVMVNKHILICS